MHYPAETISSPRLAPYRAKLDRTLRDLNDERWDRLEPAWSQFIAMLRPGGRLADVRYPAERVDWFAKGVVERLQSNPLGLLYLHDSFDRNVLRLLPDRWPTTAHWRDLVFRELDQGGSPRDEAALLLAMTCLLLAEGTGGVLSKIPPYLSVFTVQLLLALEASGLAPRYLAGSFRAALRR